MPNLASNVPFTEHGMSMVQRSLEDLYLRVEGGTNDLNAGALDVTQEPEPDIDLSVCLQVANNLSDVSDAAEARMNLGLGSAATTDSADYLTAANNLSDVADAATARSNLGISSNAFASANGFSTGVYTGFSTYINFGTSGEIDPDGLMSGGIYSCPRTGSLFVTAVISCSTSVSAAGGRNVAIGVDINGSPGYSHASVVANATGGTTDIAFQLIFTGVLSVNGGDAVRFWLNAGTVSATYTASNFTAFYL